MRIITLGPEGTFSHEAALSLFPQAQVMLAPNVDVLFETVAGDGMPGFVPFENSLHGSVDEVLDLLISTDVYVWKTHDVSIHHALGGQKRTEIKRIASHPQAIAQCRKYLHKHFPDAEYFPVSSTAFAIDLALHDPHVAAIASKKAMAKKKLPLIAEDLAENGNMTRFAVIAKDDPFPELKRTQMGIVFHPTGDHPGLLHKILTPFKIYDVNLTRIENRPTGKGLGDYHFFLHFEGSPDDARTKKALEELRSIEGIDIVKFLGQW